MAPNNNASSNYVAAWFQSVQDSAPTPPPPAPAPKKNKLPLIIILGVGSLMIVALTIVLLIANKTAPCLTAADYATLTGVKVDAASLSPTTSFYTSPVSFTSGTNAYDNSTDEGATGSALVKKISDFYKDHSESSIILSIKGTYGAKEALGITEQRVDTVKASLIAQGVPEASIQVLVPEYLIPEEDTPGDASSILISITSSETCS